MNTLGASQISCETLAAEMPAKWAPVPSAVVEAIHDGGGRVPYTQVAADFR